MRWYFGMNEAATTHGVGLHARIAVESATTVGGLEPVMLYTGARNDYTAWMEQRGVRVVDTEPTFAPVIRAEAEAGRYSLAHLGHWLRTRIPLLEREHEFVVYTDCDVVFLRRPDLDRVRPRFIAVAPEFQPGDWRYFNSGVMVMNVPALRDDYPGFAAYIADSIWAAAGGEFLDQTAYNAYYEKRWERLDPGCNWKTYWSASDTAPILHFHGPKIDVMLRIMQGGWPWDDVHCNQLGSLLLGNLDHVLANIRLVLARCPTMFQHARDLLQAILDAAPRFAAEAPRDRIDLAFARGW